MYISNWVCITIFVFLLQHAVEKPAEKLFFHAQHARGKWDMCREHGQLQGRIRSWSNVTGVLRGACGFTV